MLGMADFVAQARGFFEVFLGYCPVQFEFGDRLRRVDQELIVP